MYLKAIIVEDDESESEVVILQKGEFKIVSISGDEVLISFAACGVSEAVDESCIFEYVKAIEKHH